MEHRQQGVESSDFVQLSLDADSIDKHCHDLARHQPNMARRIVALDALATFISATSSPAEKVKPQYAAIRQAINHHLEQAHNAMLEAHRTALARALAEQEILQIMPVYTALSRDAFWQLLSQASTMLSPAQLHQATVWCCGWLADVKTRSAAVCPYPDTIDFKAVNVDITEFTAMNDLCSYLQAQATA